MCLYMPHCKTFDLAQGMAIYGGEAFVLYHFGSCGVYDLAAKTPEPIGTFRLGSYNEGVPDSRYANHANSAMFSESFHQGNTVPLLYVTTGNDGGTDADGYIGRCAVENIIKTTDKDGNTSYMAELIQTIIYNDKGIESTEWETPCWGWPASFVDSQNGWYYIFSARYRTSMAFKEYYDKNAFIITKFDLPKPTFSGETVTLTPADIIDQFTAPFDIFVTQGGTLYGGKIYYTFGFGTPEAPNGIRVFDLENKKMADRIDLSNSIFANEEIEGCAVYNGTLLCNTADANIYQLDYEVNKN